MSDKTNNKTKTTKQPVSKKPQIKKNPLKEQNDLLNKKIINLELQNIELKNQITVANDTYLNKAKELQKEAQEKIEVFREEHKKHSEKEIAHIKKFASAEFFEDFIEPLLNIELAINAGKNQDDAGVKNYVIGFSMLLKQIENIMKEHNVVKIMPSVGDKFDPETMAAVQIVEDKSNADKIIKIKKPGYKMYDRVLKPASVIIGK